MYIYICISNDYLFNYCWYNYIYLLYAIYISEYKMDPKDSSQGVANKYLVLKCQERTKMGAITM